MKNFLLYGAIGLSVLFGYNNHMDQKQEIQRLEERQDAMVGVILQIIEYIKADQRS